MINARTLIVSVKKTFTPRQLQLEDNGFENNLQTFFKGIHSAWNNSVQSAYNVAAPVVGIAVAAKSKNPKSSKSLSGCKVLR